MKGIKIFFIGADIPVFLVEIIERYFICLAVNRIGQKVPCFYSIFCFKAQNLTALCSFAKCRLYLSYGGQAVWKGIAVTKMKPNAPVSPSISPRAGYVHHRQVQRTKKQALERVPILWAQSREASVFLALTKIKSPAKGPLRPYSITSFQVFGTAASGQCPPLS